MTKKSNKVDMLQRYSPIISMASAIIAAALTAFVSFKVASVESDTQRLVASLEAETQKLVATLKTETEKTIGFSMHNIKKAELFHSLISELKNEEKGSLVNGLLELSHFRSSDLSHIPFYSEAHSLPPLSPCLGGGNYFLLCLSPHYGATAGPKLP